MIDISFVILLVWLTSVLLLKTIVKGNSNVVILVITWWFLWLYISTYSFGGIDTPTDNTYLYFLTVLISVTIGSVSFIFVKNKTIARFSSENWNDKRDYKINNIVNFLIKINYFIIFPSMLYFLFKALYLILTIDSIGLFRSMAMGSGDETSKIFSNLLLQYYYSWFVMPIVMVSMFVGISSYISKLESKLLIISFVGLLMSSLISLGRGQIFMFLILYVIVIIYQNSFKILAILRSKSIIKALSILLLIILITFARTEGNIDFKSLFNIFVINYHTCGFAIFNDELMDPVSYLNTHTTYGMASTGAVSYFTGIWYHLFDNSFHPIPEEVGRALNTYKNLGFNEDGIPLFYNAFGTVMYSIYLDGGLLFSILLSFLYGFYITKHIFLSKYKSNYSYYSLSLVFLFIYISFSGLFVPTLSGNVILYFIFLFILFKTNLSTLILNESTYKNHQKV
ncbi:MAG: O-antigen polymerase [Sulfuricurvum sp.]|nr:O-antigen polymerase [Sulfuricurvum sp.]